jgi:kinesin family protein 13
MEEKGINKETERTHDERQQTLEGVGVSVEGSGIEVERGEYYLVNLNADSTINELFVYYLKERTLIGRSDAPIEQDIQLSGSGIMPQHCTIEINKSTNEIIIIPLEGARTCVNGLAIKDKILLKHGDCIFWGNNSVVKF